MVVNKNIKLVAFTVCQIKNFVMCIVVRFFCGENKEGYQHQLKNLIN